MTSSSPPPKPAGLAHEPSIAGSRPSSKPLGILPESPLTVLIAEGDPRRLGSLRQLVQSHPLLQLVAESSNGLQLVDQVETTRPEVAFVDCQMPRLCGLAALENLQRCGLGMPSMVLTATDDRFAIRAFELNAVDFLIKPLEMRRFEEAVRRLCFFTVLSQSLERLGPSVYSDGIRDRIFLRSGATFTPVRTNEVLYFQAADHAADGATQNRTFLIHRTLSQLALDLEPRFFKINRSALINRDRIAEIHRFDQRRVAITMEDGHLFVASKSRSRWIRRELLAGRQGVLQALPGAARSGNRRDATLPS